MEKIVFKRRFFIFGLGILLLVIFLPGYTKIQELRDRNRDLEEKSRKLVAENTLLERELKRIESDRVYQEKILRQKLGVVRKDEIPVKIVQEKE
jgi:cell division protein FtsB